MDKGIVTTLGLIAVGIYAVKQLSGKIGIGSNLQNVQARQTEKTLRRNSVQEGRTERTAIRQKEKTKRWESVLDTIVRRHRTPVQTKPSRSRTIRKVTLTQEKPIVTTHSTNNPFDRSGSAASNISLKSGRSAYVPPPVVKVTQRKNSIFRRIFKKLRGWKHGTT